MKSKSFASQNGNVPLPVFFPDATQGTIKTCDFTDVAHTHTPGVLVNTYHLYLHLNKELFGNYHNISQFLGWQGAVISDSGGFQVASIAKKQNPIKAVSDAGVTFIYNNKKILFTPEKSIEFQMLLGADMLVVLDDFTQVGTTYEQAKKSVERTIYWAKRSKEKFESICKLKNIPINKRPYLLGVVQGGDYLDLRKECTQELVKIGFDGLGYGGWPIMPNGKFNYEVPKVIADNTPKDYLLYGLGVGKPEEIVGCHKLGFTIFDCVLPTRDARHKRLYVYNANSIKDINVNQAKFYSFYTPSKQKYQFDNSPVSTACDCLLCTNYTRGYLVHLFKIKEVTAQRLSTMHNLRFYSILMEKLRVL